MVLQRRGEYLKLHDGNKLTKAPRVPLFFNALIGLDLLPTDGSEKKNCVFFVIDHTTYREFGEGMALSPLARQRTVSTLPNARSEMVQKLHRRATKKGVR